LIYVSLKDVFFIFRAAGVPLEYRVKG
jgi:hypothetical protein